MIDFGLSQGQLAQLGAACLAAMLALPLLAAARRELAKFRGRCSPATASLLAACLFGAFVVGGTKTNGVNNLPPQPLPPQLQPIHGGVSVPLIPATGFPLPALNPAPQASQRELAVRGWNICGAWDDSFWNDFGDGFVFPEGTNHLSGVEVLASGEVWRTPFDDDAVASLGVPVSIVPGTTTFSCGMTTNGSCRFDWTDAAVGRDPDSLMTASIELFRNGDVAVTTNGATAYVPRTLPFPHSGFGQDAEWVEANFTNAAEILSAGYPQWVDAQVGVGLTNGLYKLTVTLAEDPPETTFLSVGDLSVAVTNSGDYVFLLEKGPTYDLGFFPASSNITVSAADDAPSLRASWAWESARDGEWSMEAGEFYTDYEPACAFARCWWLPGISGTPDVAHLWPESASAEFSAVLIDCCRTDGVTFEWSAGDGLCVASPNSQTTLVEAETMPDWAYASLAVTARFDGGPVTSWLGFSVGTNAAPQVACSLGVQGVLFADDATNRLERVYPVTVSLVCPAETNATVSVSHSGAAALFWEDAAMTTPLAALTNIELSSVGPSSAVPSYTFYMTALETGSGTFTAMFELPSGDTRGVEKTYRAVEPLRRQVCTERDGAGGYVFNPSRLVWGRPARLKVGANGNFAPEEVEWRVVSGPGQVVRDEDDFGDADWTATVTATADSGEVVVEARFNEDAIQPRFVLPVVQMRTVPVRAFVVSANNKPIVSAEAIQSKIDYANVIFSQVGVELNLLSISNNVGSASDLVLRKMEMYTNANGRVYTALSGQATALLNTYTAGDCVELYFVEKIVNKHVLGFCDELGVVVSNEATDHAVAHEIGHALGLKDCYSQRRDGAVHIANGSMPVTGDFFMNRHLDWGLESGRGFYAVDDTASAVLPRLLMFGEDGNNEAIDIPSGAVYSLKKNASSPLQTSPARVGADFIKTNIEEVYSK